MLHSMTRKLMLVIATAVMVLLMGGRLVTNSQVSAFNEHAARQLVLKHVPATAVRMETQAFSGYYNFHYYDIPTSLHYRIDVDSRTGQLKEMRVSLEEPVGSRKVLLNERIVRSIIGRQFEEAAVKSVQLLAESGIKRFHVSFEWAGLYGLASVNPETGELLEYSLQPSPRMSIPYAEEHAVTAQAITANAVLPADQIRTIAMNHIVGGSMIDLRQQQQDGSAIYVVRVYKDQSLHTLVVDAVTGIVRSLSLDDEPRPQETELPARGLTAVDADRLLKNSGHWLPMPQ